MAYDWNDYRGYLTDKINEAAIFADGHSSDELVTKMIEQAENRSHTAVGKTLAETFVFESLTYGMRSMAERTGLEIKDLKTLSLTLAVG